MKQPKEYTRSGREVTISDRVIDKITKGVAVITTRTGEQVNGMTASWFTRVSEVPVLVMVSVWKENYSHELIQRSGVFAINIMAEGQVTTAKHFGRQSGRVVDKFKDIDYEVRKTASPVLKDCLGFLDCRLVSSLEAGDHTIFIGEVLDAGFQSERNPLIYDRNDYPYLTQEELIALKNSS